MGLTALPDDWIIEEGALGTDVIQDTGTYLSGGRSIKFQPTATATRIVSKLIPVNAGQYGGSTQLTARRYLGLTLVYQTSGSITPSDLEVGVRYYDVNGAYITRRYKNSGATASGVWLTDGLIDEAPANAQYIRLYIEWSHASESMLVDSFIPYIMPPFANGIIKAGSSPVSLTLGIDVQIPVNVRQSPILATTWGTQCIADDTDATVSTGYLDVRETGTYIIEVEAILDDWDSGDAFQLYVDAGAGSRRRGQLFAPGIASSALLGTSATITHLAMSTQLRLEADTLFRFLVRQSAGSVAKNITDLEFWITKET